MSKALEAAAAALSASNDPQVKRWAREVITAFLDAAAEDEETRIAVTAASSGAEFRRESPGKAAILALKESVNADPS